MAVTVMFGLAFATVLAMIVIPVLYACFYRVPPAPESARGEHRTCQRLGIW